MTAVSGQFQAGAVSHAFYEDEVRCGFFVPSMMKHNWAAQMRLLEIVNGICERHNVRWFADSGTLLGAVRHKGFIPWDDDIDISMMREDFERFLCAAEKELPDEFHLVKVRDVGAETFRITNKVEKNQIISTDPEHLNKHCGFPYWYSIDIFPLDGVWDDAKKEENRIRLLAEMELMIEEETDPDTLLSLTRKREAIRMECSTEEADRLALFWHPLRYYFFEKKWFEETVYLPFEHMLIPAPSGYREVLTEYYKDYQTVVVDDDGHGYPGYEEQADIAFGQTGFRLLRYTFRKEDLVSDKSGTRNAESALQAQKAKLLLEQAQSLMAEGKNEIAAELLRRGKAIVNAMEASDGDDRDTKREALFLPVRTEWWKPMERVYRVFAEDEAFETYVMPVSWYEKNNDGSSGAERDETETFSGMVPAVSPAEYDVSARKPDVIVIQFPYDEWGGAMNVPEQYYASNLRKYTDRLIYVPYLDDQILAPRSGKHLKTLRYYTETPGFVFADEVWTVSEELRGAYIDLLCDITGEENRVYWSGKIVVR